MFKSFLTFVSILALSGAFNPQPRISGGYKTLIEQFPHQVSIRSRHSHKCGGTILKPNLIVTAASCISNESISDLSIAAGSNSLEIPQQVLEVARTRVHEMYSDAFNRDCNIALLELHQSLLFGENVQPIRLQHRQPLPSTAALVAGWGVIFGAGAGTFSHELRAAGLRVLPDEDCATSFQGKGYSTDRMLCGAVHIAIPLAHQEEAVGPCSGDDGAGLICTDEMALCGIAWVWNYACGVDTTDRAISGYTRINHPDIINWLKRYV